MTERALILAGGSARGISQVGVLEGILKEDPDIEYTFLGGNSVGAINAAFLSQFKMGRLSKGIERLKEIWFGIKGNKDIWKGGLLAVFRPLWDNGFADPSPLIRIIQNNYDPEKVKESGRKLRISTVDLLAGQYKEFGEKDITWEHIYGSAAMPYAFPAIMLSDGNGYLTDGGVLRVAPIKTAIKLGYQKIDIVLNYPVDREKRIHQKELKYVKPMLRYAMRILDLILDDQFVLDMKLCLAYNLLAQSGITEHQNIDVRIYAPDYVLSDNLILMNFSPETMQQWYEDSLKTRPIGLEEFLERVG